MSESLSQKRCRFTKEIALLIVQAEMMGYQAALDQVKRTQAEANANATSGAGIANSLHLIGLAADILLYKDGVYLQDTESYRPLGEWWERSGTDHRWGGRFKRADGNHFSIEHNGVR